MFAIQLVVVLVAFLLLPGLGVSVDFLSNSTCPSDTFSCGIDSTCCPNSGYICNLNRGIPACEELGTPTVSGYDAAPCADPYLYDCSSLIGISGKCCPVGTVCFNNGIDSAVSCIDVYGTTESAYPSATTGFIPSASAVVNNDPAVVYSPPNAWSSSSSVPSCASGKSLQVTSTVNATVSFNYSGPSILIHTVTSQQGGVFAVLADGFNTIDSIDTYGNSSTPTLPQCYPTQFPPYTKPPPDLEMRDTHTITLIYVGPSPFAPNGTTGEVQFDAFAIPEFSQSSGIRLSGLGIYSKIWLALIQVTLVSIY